MADYNGAVASSILSGPNPNAQTINNAVPSEVMQGLLLSTGGTAAGIFERTGEGTKDAFVSKPGHVNPGVPQYWFEKVHTWPAALELGNILTTLVRDLELYNSYREEARTLTAFVNNADSGVSLLNFPSLPYEISAQNGLIFQVRIDSSGPAVLDGTLDYTLDSGSVSVPITGNRVIMFPFEPESPILEHLTFRTDVLMGVDSSEQRINVRKHPRQVLQVRVKVEDDHERRRMATQLSAWHPRVFGLPIWFEARPLDAAAAVDDTSVQVDTTYADFRVDSLAIIWQDSEVYDALEIASMTSSSLTFSSPLVNDYDENAIVMPLRQVVSEPRMNRRNWQVNLAEVVAQFTTLDNETDFASTAAFSTHNSKVMLDDANIMRGSTVSDHLTRHVDRLDSEAGKLVQFSDWDQSLPVTEKGFIGNTLQDVWQVRQLAHALKGSQTSFYLPTFFTDVVAADILTSGSDALDIENIGYALYLLGQEPNKSLWIELTDGTILTRQVTAAAEISSTVERLTVDIVWGSTITPAEISRISFLRLCRIADDKISFRHDYPGQALIGMNVQGVIR